MRCIRRTYALHRHGRNFFLSGPTAMHEITVREGRGISPYSSVGSVLPGSEQMSRFCRRGKLLFVTVTGFVGELLQS